ESLRGAHVVIIPDNDIPGHKHAAKVKAALEGVAADVVVIHLPGLGDVLPKHGKDVSDWIATGGTAQELQELVKNPPPEPETPEEGPPQVGVFLSEVEPEHITWLFHGRIPYGKLTVLDGDPGQGKSTIAFDIAARLSEGHSMPDGSGGGEPAGVVILSSEDGLRDTIRLRMEAAGADLESILVLNSCPDDDGGHPPVLPDDLAVIEKAIEQARAKLVIVDPLMAYMGETNAHKDSEVRKVLSRVAELAEKTGAAFLVIRHFNKMEGAKVMYRGGGSIGIIGAARSGLVVANDPDSNEGEERHVLASQKCNVDAKPEGLAYRIEEVHVDHNGEQFRTSRIVWEGTSPHDANALLAQADDGERGALEEAMEVLESILTGGRVQADEVKRQCRQAGVSERTANRAKSKLKIKSVHPVIPGPWYWELPILPSSNPVSLGNLGNLGNLEAEKEAYGSQESQEVQGCQDFQIREPGHLGEPESPDSEPEQKQLEVNVL
ncbi:MAG: AAA family ATPase, partial [Thermoleophilia bacterium]|nr:AAA family ATPase [Thermoleophilia bacterium]